MTKLSLMLAAAALLAACSGGSDYAKHPPAPPPAPADPPVAGTEVPTSATVSSVGATNFVSTTAAAGSETSEPLELGGAMLAISDTDEPRD
jgi:ABC-type glycerol-3-phosphate transport system substrate-binding protein